MIYSGLTFFEVLPAAKGFFAYKYREFEDGSTYVLEKRWSILRSDAEDDLDQMREEFYS